MGWLPESADGATSLDRVFGLRANLYAAYRDFVALLWERRPVDPLLLELCRLRVAGIHACGSELALRHAPALADGLDAAKAAAAERGDLAAFDARERAVLAFAEMFARDPHAIGDADAARVVEHLGEPGLVALTYALALFDGFCRFRVLLGVEPDASGVVAAPRVGDASAY